MSGAVIVLNAGSSSIKFAAFACDASSYDLAGRLLHGEIDGVGTAARLVAWNACGVALAVTNALMRSYACSAAPAMPPCTASSTSIAKNR